MKRPERVGVIGVGVIGASVGWNLSRHGAGVVFIDAGQPGEGVTSWSFSWVNASNKTARKFYFDLNVAGMAAHRELAWTIGPDSWWFPSGHVRWADDPQRRRSSWRQPNCWPAGITGSRGTRGPRSAAVSNRLSRCPTMYRSCSTPTKPGCTDAILSAAWSARPSHPVPSSGPATRYATSAPMPMEASGQLLCPMGAVSTSTSS